MTDSNGFYSFGGVDPGDYAVLPSKDGDFRSTVGILDALIAARHSVGLFGLDTYQLLAADVDGFPSITINDAYDIAVFSAGLSTHLDVGRGLSPEPSDWYFEPVPAQAPGQVVHPVAPSAGNQGSIQFLPLSQAVAEQNFCAGLFGDVDADWSTAPPPPPGPVPPRPALESDCSLPDASGVDQVTLSLPEGSGALPGSSGLVAVSIDDATGMRSNHLVLEHDASVAGVTDVGPTDLLDCYSLVSKTGVPGESQVAYFRSDFCGTCDPAQSTSAGEELVTLTMEALGPLGSITPLEISFTDYNHGEVPW